MRSEVDESRVWEPVEDATIDIEAVTKSTMRQGIVASAEDNDSTYFKRIDLDIYANMLSLIETTIS